MSNAAAAQIKRIEFGDVFGEDGRRQSWEVGQITPLKMIVTRIVGPDDRDPWFRVFAMPKLSNQEYLLDSISKTSVVGVFHEGEGGAK